MIKLIASDMDGTLLTEGTPDINPEILEVILKLKEKGIIFAAASGRQYASMREVFRTIQDDIIFIAENGGYVVCKGREIERCSFGEEIRVDTINYIRSLKDCFIMVSSPEMSYTDSDDLEFIEILRTGYKVRLERVDDVMKLEVPVVKAAMYCKADAQSMAAPAADYFKGRLNVMASGAHWVDFVLAEVDKGNALARVQKIMNIKKEETMVFGDNNNDIGMMNCAGESYAMANARDEVKRTAKHIADSNENNGVLKVLKTLI